MAENGNTTGADAGADAGANASAPEFVATLIPVGTGDGDALLGLIGGVEYAPASPAKGRIKARAERFTFYAAADDMIARERTGTWKSSASTTPGETRALLALFGVTPGPTVTVETVHRAEAFRTFRSTLSAHAAAVEPVRIAFPAMVAGESDAKGPRVSVDASVADKMRASLIK